MTVIPQAASANKLPTIVLHTRLTTTHPLQNIISAKFADKTMSKIVNVLYAIKTCYKSMLFPVQVTYIALFGTGIGGGS